MSASQKLAWAKEHGVQAPTWFAKLAKKESGHSSESPRPCCAVAKAAKTCCSGQATGHGCKSQSGHACAKESANDEEAVTFKIFFGKRRCHGIDHLYVMLSMVLPVQHREPMELLTSVDRLGPIVSLSWEVLRRDDLNRPPQHAIV